MVGLGKGRCLLAVEEKGASVCALHRKLMEKNREAAIKEAGRRFETSAGQCLGVTAKGKRCRRLAAAGLHTCRLHHTQEHVFEEEEVVAAPEPAAPAAAVEKRQCAGKTTKGERCRRPAPRGFTTCATHREQQEQEEEEEKPQSATPAAAAAATPAAAAHTCEAHTKKGQPCGRKTAEKFCWQHRQ